MKNLLMQILSISIFFLGCSHSDPRSQVDAGPDVEVTGEVCEAAVDQAACEKAGCLFTRVGWGIMNGSSCVALNEAVAACLAVEDPSGNLMSWWHRETESGPEIMMMGDTYSVVDGWIWCEEPFGGDCRCRVDVSVCEAQLTQEACEAKYCFWAEDIRVGIVHGETCSGYEAETISRCLTPAESLRFYEGTNVFLMNAEPVTYYFDSGAGTQVFTFSANPGDASFRSGSDQSPVNWMKCGGGSSDPPLCDCHE